MPLPPTELEGSLIKQINSLCEELDRREARHKLLRPYARKCEDDRMAIPRVIGRAKLMNAYDAIMNVSGTPWGKLVVTSKLDRLEVAGFKTGDSDLDQRVSDEIWQPNAMDLESKLGHRASLHDGRSHALVWPDENDEPEISLDDATQMIVQYRDGSRRVRVAALRRWEDDDGTVNVTLYRRDFLWKFSKKHKGETPVVEGSDWVPRVEEEDDGEWPLPNPFGVVPVIELAVNRELAGGKFTDVRGEFEDEIGLIDRINLLTFLGLVVAIWMGFPLRGVISEKVFEDDDGNAVAPFDSKPDSVVQIEDAGATTFEFKAADRANLSIFDELGQLASSTTTPRHHFPMNSTVANVSADLIRAFEGGMNATVKGSHQPSLGEGWETVVALAGLMLPEGREFKLPRTTETLWINHESRALSEQADAFLKLTQGGLSFQAAAEFALNASQDTARRWAEDLAEQDKAELAAGEGDDVETGVGSGI